MPSTLLVIVVILALEAVRSLLSTASSIIDFSRTWVLVNIVATAGFVHMIWWLLSATIVGPA